jgi:hypothetical protein
VSHPVTDEMTAAALDAYRRNVVDLTTFEAMKLSLMTVAPMLDESPAEPDPMWRDALLIAAVNGMAESAAELHRFAVPVYQLLKAGPPDPASRPAVPPEPDAPAVIRDREGIIWSRAVGEARRVEDGVASWSTDGGWATWEWINTEFGPVEVLPADGA